MCPTFWVASLLIDFIYTIYKYYRVQMNEKITRFDFVRSFQFLRGCIIMGQGGQQILKYQRAQLGCKGEALNV